MGLLGLACSFPMAAACGEYNIQPEVIQSYEAAGLELDHAYSVLDVMTTHDGSRFVLWACHKYVVFVCCLLFFFCHNTHSVGR